MEYLEQIWTNITQVPRYSTYTGLILNLIGIVFITIANLQRGPIGSRFSGKQPADGSRNKGPRPGQESISVVRRRWVLSIIGMLSVAAGVWFQINAI